MQLSLSGKRRREVIFGLPPAFKMDRNDRARLWVYCRAYNARHRRPGQHGGPLSHAALRVLASLIDHINWGTGHTFPALKTIATGANCQVSTVQLALAALEEAGVLTWVNRIVRCRFTGSCPLTGKRIVIVRPRRTSNAYIFKTPWRAAGFDAVCKANRLKKAGELYDTESRQVTTEFDLPIKETAPRLADTHLTTEQIAARQGLADYREKRGPLLAALISRPAGV